MSRVCRLCLSHDSEVYSEIDNENRLEQFKSVIPEIDLGLTECPLICINCSDLLLNAYTFKLNCLKTEEKLKSSCNEIQNKIECKAEDTTGEEYGNIAAIDNISIDQTSDYLDSLLECVEEKPLIHCQDIPVDSNNCASEKSSIVKSRLKQKTKKIFLCKFCGLRLSTNLDWREHMKIHRGTNNTCQICSKTFETRSQLLSHRDVHRINKCTFCGQEFLYKSTFSRHMKEQHAGEKLPVKKDGSKCTGPAGRYECNVCGLKTKEKYQLIEHIRTHTGERPYKCSLCDKAFAQSSTLSTHIKTMHLTDRPYQCEICGKGYAVRGAYTVHVKTHQNLPKNFICDHCGKAFSIRGKLREHMKRHSGETTVVCHVCSKILVNIRGLKKHMRTHTGEKPHECIICQKKFTEQYNMKTHFKSCAKRSRCRKAEQKMI